MCTFTILPVIQIVCAPEYEAIKAELQRLGIDLSAPTYAFAPLPDGQFGPGSYSDSEQLAVKETADTAVIAHELAHIWTNAGNEVHTLEPPPDNDGNPFNDIVSVLGEKYTAFPYVILLPEHLSAALAAGYIRST